MLFGYKNWRYFLMFGFLPNAEKITRKRCDGRGSENPQSNRVSVTIKNKMMFFVNVRLVC